jgi:hypothetical protein
MINAILFQSLQHAVNKTESLSSNGIDTAFVWFLKGAATLCLHIRSQSGDISSSGAGSQVLCGIQHL